MAVTTDIVRTWKGPRAVMRDLLAQGRREERSLAILMAACFVIFIGQWPRLTRKAQGFEAGPGADVLPMSELLTYELFAWIIIWPLLFYALAAVSHLVARAMGGHGDAHAARLALFWSLLASTPLALLHGLTIGLVGPGLEANLVGALWLIVFGIFWVQSLREAEFG